jgi:hypothetical protein
VVVEKDDRETIDKENIMEERTRKIKPSTMGTGAMFR